MRKRPSVIAALAAPLLLVPFASSTPAVAAASFCSSQPVNTSLVFYDAKTGAAVTGTLAAGHWQEKAKLTLPVGYTHGAASRDSLLLYNTDRGVAESGTFRDGVYTRQGTYGSTFVKGWDRVEATGNSVLLYSKEDGHALTGYLTDGRFEKVASYTNFLIGWDEIAGSCDTMVFSHSWWKDVGKVSGGELGYGTLRNGLYAHTGSVQLPDKVWYDDGTVSRGGALGPTVATKDSLLSMTGYNIDASGVFTSTIRVATADRGVLGPVREIGTVGDWQEVARTGDSVLFYKSDSTSSLAYSGTLVAGNYLNVGTVPNIKRGYQHAGGLIEGGV